MPNERCKGLRKEKDHLYECCPYKPRDRHVGNTCSSAITHDIVAPK